MMEYSTDVSMWYICYEKVIVIQRRAVKCHINILIEGEAVTTHIIIIVSILNSNINQVTYSAFKLYIFPQVVNPWSTTGKRYLAQTKNESLNKNINNTEHDINRKCAASKSIH